MSVQEKGIKENIMKVEILVTRHSAGQFMAPLTVSAVWPQSVRDTVDSLTMGWLSYINSAS